MDNSKRSRSARQTLTISAVVEGIYFGLAFLLIPSVLANLVSTTAPTTEVLLLFRSIGVLAFALAVGCWYARAGTESEVKLMSLIMVVAKTGSTLILIAMMLSLENYQAIGWINPIITAFLASINLRLFMSVK